MKILREIVKQVTESERTVETAQIIDQREGYALLQTARGRVWSRSGLSARDGQWVTFARVGTESQVLSLASKPKQVTKTVRA